MEVTRTSVIGFFTSVGVLPRTSVALDHQVRALAERRGKFTELRECQTAALGRERKDRELRLVAGRGNFIIEDASAGAYPGLDGCHPGGRDPDG
jgi:hypothetical protein